MSEPRRRKPFPKAEQEPPMLDKEHSPELTEVEGFQRGEQASPEQQRVAKAKPAVPGLRVLAPIGAEAAGRVWHEGQVK